MPDHRNGLAICSGGLFWPPGDHCLSRNIIPVHGFADTGIEAEVTDRQREVVSASVAILLLPDAAAFEFDAVGSHCFAPSFDVAMMVKGQGPKT